MDQRADVAPAAVILFDLDGTLMDSEPLHAEALARTLASYGVDDPGDMHEEALGRTVEVEYAIAARRFGIAAPFREWIARKYGYYFELLPTLRPREGVPDLFRRLDLQTERVAVERERGVEILHRDSDMVENRLHLRTPASKSAATVYGSVCRAAI